MTPEMLGGIIVAFIGLAGSVWVALINIRSNKATETTKRFEVLFDSQGQEITRLSSELDKLRSEFKEEQAFTELLQEESNRWRGLLQEAFTYLRRLHAWQTEGHPPPPPPMPSNLMQSLWEDL